MYSFPPIAAAIGVLDTVVTGLTAVLTPLLGPASAAAAIIALTVIVRILLLPLGYAQARGEHVRARLLPKVQELQRKYRHDRERLHRELTELYRREGTSPLAGCMPALAQAPVFIVLYGLFLTPEIGGEPNVLLTDTLAGVPLGARVLELAATTDLLVFAVLFVLLTLVAFAARRLTPAPPGGMPGAGLVRLLPFGTVLVAALVPLAAGVYLVTTTAWTVAERTFLRRLTAPAAGSRG